MPDNTLATMLKLEESAKQEIGSPLNSKIGLVYALMATDLSEIAQRPKPWGGGYIRNVVLLSQPPSDDLREAVVKLKEKKDRDAKKKAGFRRMYLEMNCSPKEMKIMQSEKDLRARALRQLGITKEKISPTFGQE